MQAFTWENGDFEFLNLKIKKKKNFLKISNGTLNFPIEKKRSFFKFKLIF